MFEAVCVLEPVDVPLSVVVAVFDGVMVFDAVVV